MLKNVRLQKALLPVLMVVVALCSSCKPLDLSKKYPHAKSSQIFEINSSPEGATVIYDGKKIGVTPCEVELPLPYNIPVVNNFVNNLYTENKRNKVLEETQKLSAMTFKFIKVGYFTGEETIYPNANFNYNGIYYPSLNNAFIVSVDYPEGVFHEMQKSDNENIAYEKDPTIMAGEADNMVSRDNPGGTALERTIIRWYFDSEPRGARLYWRVVSSIPSIVKNTNELYLGTTPYEETRSFNILGLTYENSRDVQIEIKLSRPGYIDQVKRFNVRQAIDQQEISSFFDLVKKVE